MTNNNKIKVFIVDDSALMRQSLKKILQDDYFIEIADMASNAQEAAQKIIDTPPDVILLDIHMPKTNGLTLLKKIMQFKPIPVIIFSSYAEEGSANALKALELGAVDIIEKPKLKISSELQKYKDTLIKAIKSASTSKPQPTPKLPNKINFSTNKQPPIIQHLSPNNSIIAIGASTGGTEAIKRILIEIPEYFPPIIITQHMPAGFTNSFANRLNELCNINVFEAYDNAPLIPGTAYIARGDRHLIIQKKGLQKIIKLQDTPPVNRHKPSVDVMFKSVAETYGKNTIAIILTGMGADGAKGIKLIHEKGGFTIAQNQETCVVFGMPKVAISMKAIDTVLPIYQISAYIRAIIPSKNK